MISIIINTYNESHNIIECIESINKLATEIIVCDMYSTDNTVELAKKMGATVYYHPKEIAVEPARFFAISKASYSWVYVIDADERMPQLTIFAIQEAIILNKYDLLYIWCKNFYFDKYLNFGGFLWMAPRCFKKELYINSYSESENIIHGQFSNIQKKAINPKKFNKDIFFLHNAYPSIEMYIKKTVGHYAWIEAMDEYKRGKRFSLLKAIIRPVKSFISRYIFLRGYKDGFSGFLACFLFSFYLFVKEINLWQIGKLSPSINSLK